MVLRRIRDPYRTHHEEGEVEGVQVFFPAPSQERMTAAALGCWQAPLLANGDVVRPDEEALHVAEEREEEDEVDDELAVYQKHIHYRQYLVPRVEIAFFV